MIQKLLELDRSWSAGLAMGGRAPVWKGIAVLLAHSGDSWFWFAGLGLLWWLGDETWRWRAALLLIGVIISAVLVMTIKLLVRRRRPEGEWGSIYRRTDPHSFPSGHAARTLMLAVLALFTGPVLLGACLIIWAPLVSLARVSLGIHYLSDVAAGMVLGLALGLLLPFFLSFSQFLF